MASPIRCLVTAGPTREFFDPVRFVSNPSSGKMGYALAGAAAEKGWIVDLVSGPVSLGTPPGVAVEHVVTGDEMYEAVSRRFDDCDILIMTAAIIDYRPKAKAPKKVKKFELDMSIEMEPVIDVLATVTQRRKSQIIVGFAAETDHLEDYALRKLKEKRADFMVANRIGAKIGGFEREENEIILFDAEGGRTPMGPEPKVLLARRLIDIFEEKVS